jgi:hypothetical protein
MAEIPGATVTFTDYSAPASPRLLNIPDGEGDVTVQDVWDTLSAEAAKLENLVYKKLVDRPRSGGKQELGASKFAGIVMTMYNAQIKFADQAGPSFVRKKVKDGVPTANDASEPTPALIEAVAISDYTFAETEKDISAGLVGLDSIAAAVWSEDMAGYTDTSKFGGWIASLPKKVAQKITALLMIK